MHIYKAGRTLSGIRQRWHNYLASMLVICLILPFFAVYCRKGYCSDLSVLNINIGTFKLCPPVNRAVGIGKEGRFGSIKSDAWAVTEFMTGTFILTEKTVMIVIYCFL